MSSDLISNSRQNNVKDVKPSDPVVYEFDDFRLDAAHLMLYCRGKEISLTPKQVETLLALVEKSGEIVSRDDLMDRLWADAFVEESNLNQNIYILRKTLGDTSDGKPMIETLRRRGYRFNGELKASRHNVDAELLRSAEEAGSARSTSAVTTDERISQQTTLASTPRKSRTIVAAGIVGLLVAAIGLGYYFFLGSRAAADRNRSILILPLKPIDPANRSDLYFEIGIADALINRLNSMRGFLVRPLSATRRYTEVELDPLAAGREQKVDYALASNYQLADGRIRITSQLVNVATGQVEESYKFEKEATGVFLIQDAFTGNVGSKLIARFAAASSSSSAKRETNNQEAYRLYLQAMSLYDRRSAQYAQRSLDLLEEAVRLDPNYALAWAGLAHAHRYVANMGRNTDNHEEHRRSIEAINTALALDADLSEAYSALCENKFQYEHDFTGAESACKRALELDPNSPLARNIYASFLSDSGRHEEAIAEIKIAIDLEPTSNLSQRNFGMFLFYARRYEESEVQFKRVIEVDKDLPGVYQWLSRAFAMQGKETEAFEAWMKYQSLLPKADNDIIQAYTKAFQNSGWQGFLHERVKRFDNSPNSYFQGATYNIEVGDKDKAFEYLERSYQQREAWLAGIQVDPRLDPLRDDPRYADLVSRIEGR